MYFNLRQHFFVTRLLTLGFKHEMGNGRKVLKAKASQQSITTKNDFKILRQHFFVTKLSTLSIIKRKKMIGKTWKNEFELNESW